MEHGASTCLAFSESFALYSHVAEGAQDTQHCDLMMSSTSTEDLLHSPSHRRCTGPGLNLPGRDWLNVVVYLIGPMTVSQTPALMTSTNLQKPHHQILLRYKFEDFSIP